MKDILGLAKTRTVVMIAHKLSTVEQADKVLVFKSGKVESQGTYVELAKNSKEFKSLLTAGKNISPNKNEAEEALVNIIV